MKISSGVFVLLSVGVLGGCKTKEMKSTPFYEGDEVAYAGDTSERVNLWPVVYWRNPVGSVAWPVVSFSDDHLAVRPVYSQYKQSGKDGAWDDFNFVWPIFQSDTRNNTSRIFPVYWDGPHYNALFPLWYYGSTTNSWSFNTLAGLAGARRKTNAYRCSWAFPLWYEDNTGLFSTLLYGQTRDSYWVFPLWYRGEKAFVSPFYAQGVDGDNSWWSVPLALSWGKASSGKLREDGGKFLLGLGGWENNSLSNAYDRTHWWAFPLVDRKRTILAKEGKIPTTKTSVAGHISGWETKGKALKSLHVFPLFSWNDNGSWLTPLGGQSNSFGTTNTFFTPLVRVTTGKRNGGAVVPVWMHEKDADFDAKVSLIDSTSLPDCIKVRAVTNTCEKSRDFGKTYLSAKFFHSADKTGVLLHDINHSIRGNCWGWYGSATNAYEIEERHKRGNALLLNHATERKVAFDLKTRAKISDVERSEASFLLRLYQQDWECDRLKGDERTRHRVLWRLWHWEEKNGSVALDVFPGFTYDKRMDGYSKTSFLWRFFRNEHDPKTGRKVDFFFMPVWR